MSPAVGTSPAVLEPCDQVVSGDQHAGMSGAASKEHRLAIIHFRRLFTNVTGWRAAPLADRPAVREPVRAFACWAAVMTATAVDADYVLASRSKWGKHVAARKPVTKAEFYAQAASLGFDRLEVDKMWSTHAADHRDRGPAGHRPGRGVVRRRTRGVRCGGDRRARGTHPRRCAPRCSAWTR